MYMMRIDKNEKKRKVIWISQNTFQFFLKITKLNEYNETHCI